ncbi:MAG: gfo/Idh/MocA family oxidoreductase, partial [Lutimonas sp.]
MKSRRNFIQNTAMASVGLSILPNWSFGHSGKNSKINVGLIGVGLRGTNHLNNLLLREDVNIMAICDIDQDRITLNLDLMNKAGQKKPEVFGKDELDYKNLLELESLDAVII